MEKFIDIIRSRYAAKAYDPSKKLSQEQIEMLFEIANLSASSYGLQPYKIVRVVSEDLRHQLLEVSYGQRPIVDASDIFVLCYMDDVSEGYVDKYLQNISKTRNVPISDLQQMKNMLLGSLGSLSKEQIAAWNKNQTYILLGTLLSGCAAQGIDSTPMEGFIPSEYDRILGLKDLGLRSAVVLAMGYHSDSDYNFGAAKVRKGIPEMIIVK